MMKKSFKCARSRYRCLFHKNYTINKIPVSIALINYLCIYNLVIFQVPFMGGVIVPSHEIDNHVKQRLKMRRNTLPANHTTSERFVAFDSFNNNVILAVKGSSKPF